MSGLSDAERAEVLEYVAEWHKTCRQMGVAFTPESIVQWLVEDSELLPRIIAAREAAARAAAQAEALAEVEASNLAEAICRDAHPTRWEYPALSHVCDDCDIAASNVRVFLRALVAQLREEQ